MLVLLRRKRVIEDRRDSTTVLLRKELCALLETKKILSQMVLNAYLARKIGKFLLSFIIFSSSFKIWVVVSCLLLFRKSVIFLIVLVLTIGFLCRMHKVDHKDRRRNELGSRNMIISNRKLGIFPI